MAKFKSVIQETKGESVFLRGYSKWAHVIEENQFGDYSIDIYPKTHEMLEDFIEKAEAMRDAAVKEVEAAGKKINGIADVYKYDDEGDRFISAKLPKQGYNGEDNVIEFFDIRGNRVEDFNTLIGNGSDVNVRLYIKPYYMNSTKMVGISIKFYAIQVIKLVEFKDKSTGGFGNLAVEEEKTKEESGFENFEIPDDIEF